MANEFRKAIQDEIIDQLEALTFAGSMETLFTSVIKYPANVLTEYVCSVQFTSTTVADRDLTYDYREYGFRLVATELLEAEITQAELDVKTDRLADVEDRLLYFCEKVPVLLEGTIADVEIYDVANTSADYVVDQSQRGYELVLAVEFVVRVKIPVKTIT